MSNTQLDDDTTLLGSPAGVSLRRLANGGALGRYLGTDLGSVFQPIVSSDSGECVAHEAFVRAHGGGDLELSPWKLFAPVADDEALIALDRLCRTVHVLNFEPLAAAGGSLFLNVHGRLLVAVSGDHGRAFRRVIDALRLQAARVVIEMPASANPDRKLLAFVLANYRLNGFSVAANTVGLDDLEALVRVVHPDYVKLDARHLPTPELMDRAIRIATDHYIRPVFTCVESEAQRDFLLTRRCVLLQGWALGRPQQMEAHQSAQCAAPCAEALV